MFGQLIDPETLVFLGAFDPHAVVLGQRLRSAAMVEMAVREQDLFDGGAAFGHSVLNPFEIATRIDDGRALGRLADDERAVLLKRRDGNDEDLHRAMDQATKERWYQPARTPAARPDGQYAICIVTAIDRINDGPMRPIMIALTFCYNANALCADELRAALPAIRPLLNLRMPDRCQQKFGVARVSRFSGSVSVSMKFDAHVLPNQAQRA